MNNDLELVSRKVARKEGLKYYFTGKPCVRGHIDDRYVSSGGYFACLADRKFLKPRLFSTYLHPDDHAAALAYCIALNMQRGG